MSRPNFAGMSSEQLQLAVALAAQLSGTAAAPVLTWHATCPNCDHTGPVEADFGTRVIKGTTYPQSWCRTCRALPNRRLQTASRRRR